MVLHQGKKKQKQKKEPINCAMNVSQRASVEEMQEAIPDGF
jgi:hypothetical protein